jgi:hypothetical protein
MEGPSEPLPGSLEFYPTFSDSIPKVEERKKTYGWPSCLSDVHLRLVRNGISSGDVRILEETGRPAGSSVNRLVREPSVIAHLSACTFGENPNLLLTDVR